MKWTTSIRIIVTVLVVSLSWYIYHLVTDDTVVVEDYVKLPCRWNMPPVTVRKNMIFVVGDNRSMPIGEHQFGMISIKRVEGAPLW